LTGTKSLKTEMAPLGTQVLALAKLLIFRDRGLVLHLPIKATHSDLLLIMKEPANRERMKRLHRRRLRIRSGNTWKIELSA